MISELLLRLFISFVTFLFLGNTILMLLLFISLP